MRGATSLPMAAVFLFAGHLAAQSTTRNEVPGDSIAHALRVLRDELGLTTLPERSTFHTGNLIIASGTTIDTALAVYAGSLTVRGRVTRSVTVIEGDLILGTGGVVEGDAAVVRGNIVREGGEIRGSAITVGGDLRPPGVIAAPRTRMQEMWHDIGVSLATLAITIALGLGVLMFAGKYLAGTADALAAQPGKSFLFGILAQLAIMPALVLLLLALALTVIGLLLIPFAAVAFFLATLGVGAFGFLASAEVAGTALSGRRSRELPERRGRLRALLLGIMAMGAVWVLAALFTSVPILGGALRSFSVVMTWVAVTAGFGAAVLSRGGQRRRDPSPVEPEPDLSWQTPTPVTGVAAARRPVGDAGVPR